MLTPLLMLLLMTSPWFAAWLCKKLSSSDCVSRDLSVAGAMGMGLVFLFTASGHFAQTEAMVQMLPPSIPGRTIVVWVTGVLEIVIALGLFLPRTRRLAAWTAIAVLALFFPANVYAAFTHAPMGGHAWGPAYLLVRFPLQIALVLWVWFVVLCSHTQLAKSPVADGLSSPLASGEEGVPSTPVGAPNESRRAPQRTS